jgi:hypothetical protein
MALCGEARVGERDRRGDHAREPVLELARRGGAGEVERVAQLVVGEPALAQRAGGDGRPARQRRAAGDHTILLQAYATEVAPRQCEGMHVNAGDLRRRVGCA